MPTTAVLVDGGFFIKRYRYLYGMNNTAQQTSKDLHKICLDHLSIRLKHKEQRDLYRIFYYDCPPLTKKVHNPITKKAIDFSKTSESLFRQDFYKELRKLRKVALRLGRLADAAEWQIYPDRLKSLINNNMSIFDLKENDVFYNVKQKGVDMRIGLDIASLAFKKQVDQIVLIAGDSDFVPAAKLARREGIDFILDPMWNPVNPDLHEHIYPTDLKMRILIADLASYFKFF